LESDKAKLDSAAEELKIKIDELNICNEELKKDLDSSKFELNKMQTDLQLEREQLQDARNRYILIKYLPIDRLRIIALIANWAILVQGSSQT